MFRKLTFAQRFPQCWLCPQPANHTHHICRGANGRPKDECNLIRCCIACHEKMDGMPIAKQLAIVKLNNPQAYDRVKVSLLRGRQPEAITEAEVRRYLKRIAKTAGEMTAF